MSSFNWSKEEIANLNISERDKEILISEANGLVNENDRDYHHLKNYNFQNFKKTYKKEMEELQNFKRLIDAAKKCEREFEKGKYSVDSLKIELNPETIIIFTIEFYSFLGDTELANNIYNYFVHKRERIRIEKETNQEITKTLSGRCLYIPETRDLFISFYYTNHLKSLLNFIHETGHANSVILYNDHLNPIIKKYFREFEAYFMEFLAALFLGIQYNNPKITDNLIIHVLNSFISATTDLVIQEYMSKSIIPPSIDKINKKLEKDERNIKAVDFQKHTSFGPKSLNEISSSILMAYDLFANNRYDIEKAIREYKSILTSSDDNIYKILKSHNINYFEDNCQNVKEALGKARIL